MTDLKHVKVSITLIDKLDSYSKIQQGYKYNVTKKTSSLGSSWFTVLERRRDEETKEKSLNDMDLTLKKCQEEYEKINNDKSELRLMYYNLRKAIVGLKHLPDTYSPKYPEFAKELNKMCAEYDKFVAVLDSRRRELHVNPRKRSNKKVKKD